MLCLDRAAYGSFRMGQTDGKTGPVQPVPRRGFAASISDLFSLGLALILQRQARSLV